MKNFLKWPGNKNWLIQKHSNLFPVDFNNYHEPFLGGGSIFFFLEPNKSAFLYDVNDKLIEVYRAIKNNVSEVKKFYSIHEASHSIDHYYKVRELIPNKVYERAARFLYLNRACFNGIYRENLQGKFNVPIGKRGGKLNNVSLDTMDLDSASKKLKSAKLESGSYELAFKEFKRNDFVYLDPPYVLKDNKDKFSKYCGEIFTWEDQRKLADLSYDASKKGVKIMISNVNSPQIVNLYKDNKFKKIEISRRSSIAALSKYRGNYEELVIKNF